MSKGYSTVELVITGASSIGIVYAFVYMSLYAPLASNQYSDHGIIQSQSTSISDIKDNVLIIRQEVDSLASQKGVKVYQSSSTVSTIINEQ